MGKLWEPDSRNYKSRSYYQSPKRFSLPNFRLSKFNKFLIQTLASVIIFLFVWGTFQFNGNVALTMQKSIKTWFSQDSDIISVFKKVSNVGLWSPVEKAFFEITSKPVSNDFPDQLTIPVSGTLIKNFGWQEEKGKAAVYYNGITISAKLNTPIKAAEKGIVTNIGYQPDDLGRFIELTHPSGYTTTYGYCSEILVSVNQEVTKGQYIAKVGRTGNINEPQLYFQVSKKGEAINPVDLLGLKDKL